MDQTKRSTPSVKDVITFVSAVPYLLCKKKLCRTTTIAATLAKSATVRVSWAILRLIEPLFVEYAINVYPIHHEVKKPPPILRWDLGNPADGDDEDEATPKRGRASVIDAANAWGILERARACHHVCVQNVLQCKADEDAFKDLHSSAAPRWECKETLMYNEIQQDAFAGQNKVALVADPSSHAGEETAIGVLWSSQKSQAAVAMKIQSNQKRFNEDEVDMTPNVKQRNYEGKLDRREAYKEFQSCMAMVLGYTGGDWTRFQLPRGITLRRPTANEARVVRMEIVDGQEIHSG